MTGTAKDISGLMPELAFELTDSNGETYKAEDGWGTVRVMFFGFTNCPDICPDHHGPPQGRHQPDAGSPAGRCHNAFRQRRPQTRYPEKLGEYVGFFGDDIKGLTSDEKPCESWRSVTAPPSVTTNPMRTGIMTSHTAAPFTFSTRKAGQGCSCAPSCPGMRSART